MNRSTIWILFLSLVLASAAGAAPTAEERCQAAFGKSITMADEAAANKGASCRWLDNGDLTATDLNNGLQWELKTDDGSVHDKPTSADSAWYIDFDVGVVGFVGKAFDTHARAVRSGSGA